MTVNDVAQLLETTPGAVRQRARRGAFPGARRAGRDWDIPGSVIAGILAERARKRATR